MTEKNNSLLFIILILLFGVFVFALIFYQQKENQSFEGQSTLVLTPTAETPLAKDPVVLSWRKYSNPTYNFSIDVPQDWYEQDYAKAHINGGTLIAFSSDPLPCETCSYFYNGYFSIKIYNVSTDPLYYAEYEKRKESLGKNDTVKELSINNLQGIVFANTVAFEQHGWVFEFSLDVGEGQADITSSEIFQKALSSFQITSLQFQNGNIQL